MKKPDDWIMENNTLTKIFTFTDFKEAISFVNNIAQLAEQEQHHPDINIFSYNKVKITLCTHDAHDTVTEKDCAFAGKINTLIS